MAQGRGSGLGARGSGRGGGARRAGHAAAAAAWCLESRTARTGPSAGARSPQGLRRLPRLSCQARLLTLSLCLDKELHMAGGKVAGGSRSVRSYSSRTLSGA